MGLIWILSPANPLLLEYKTDNEYEMVSKIQIEARAIVLLIFRVQMDNLFIMQSEHFHDHQVVIEVSPIMFTIESKMVTKMGTIF